MFRQTLISFLTLLILLPSAQASYVLISFNPYLLVQMYDKYREKKAMTEKLEHIQRDLAELKSDLKLLINSHLKSALTALDDAQHMVNEAEKIDSIRSAKHFLTQAINVEKEPRRKALAMYLLGHVYLLLDEHQAAKRQLHNVVRFKFGQEQGLWNKTTVYEPAITQLKIDASGILCSFNDEAKAIKENWCALHVGYRGATSIALKDLERCVASEHPESCERVGYRLLKTYIDQNRVENTQESLTLQDPFKEEHFSSVNFGKDFLFNSCTSNTPNTVPSSDHYQACYWRAQVLLHKKQIPKTLAHYRVLCQTWREAQQNGADEEWISAVKSEGVHACQALYKEPLWSRLSQEDKAQHIRPLCLQGDQRACAQLLRDTHFYHPDVQSVISPYLSHQCLVKEERSFCSLIDETLKHTLKPFRLKLNELVIGLTDEGKLWDMTGDSNPEVLLTLKVGDTLIYHQQLGIKSINTDADGNPLSYQLALDPNQSLPIYLDYAKRRDLEIRLIDLDTYEDDLINMKTLKYDDFKSYTSSFGTVKKISLSLDPVVRSDTP
jgi:hypothetical protein